MRFTTSHNGSFCLSLKFSESGQVKFGQTPNPIIALLESGFSSQPSISTTSITERSKPSLCNSAELVTEFQHSHADELHYPILLSALSFALGVTHTLSVLPAPCLLNGFLSLVGVTTPTRSTSGPFSRPILAPNVGPVGPLCASDAMFARNHSAGNFLSRLG
jgi:hypothetical protein